MRSLFFVLALIAFSNTGFAQKDHLSLSMGLAQPLGDFAAKNVLYRNGFAQPGFNLSFEGNYIPRWYLGVGGAVSFSTNYLYNNDFFDLLVEDINQQSTPDIPDSTLISYESNKWSYVNMMVGPTLAIPGEHLQLNLKAFAGLSVIFPPSQNLEVSFDDSQYNHSAETQSVSLCYSIGADLIYKLQRNYSVKLGAEYVAMQAENKTKLSYTEFGSTQILPGTNQKVTIQALHFTVGLAYLF